ncbi:ATP-binding protein [Segetibacter sp.]|jgi:signal transduction histidine kinase|uniref:ATP-binding protein n=1 Tax=Segetibacter sp. TaxID=2231182 RepID=UPI002620A587|nr:ATP-binding protein [Segetibacter sp.]MCW3079537.1 hypothetical protein [Segetibacter sp.]
MKYTQNDDLLIPELFDAQPESVVWFEAVYSGNQRADGNSLDFEVSYCNNAACKFLNVTKEALIGQRLLFNSILDEASTTLIFQQSAEVYKSALPLEFTYFNQHLNKYFNVSRSKVKNGVLSVTRDITQQYLLQKRLEQQAKKFDSVINTSGDGIILFESIRDKNNAIVDFSITHTNAVGAQLGRIPSDTKGKTLLEILPHLKHSEQFMLHKQVVETGVPVQFETTFRNEKGEEYGWFIVSLLKLEDGVLSRFVDISEKKKYEEKTEKLVSELKRSNAQLSEFTYAASHDLKEPIRKINIFINQLKRTYSSIANVEGIPVWEKLELATERLQLLINNLLEYANVSGPAVEPEDIDLNEKIKNVLEELDVAIEDKKAKILVDELPKIKGYSRQIQQLFQNLIENALKYSQPGVAPEISIHCKVVLGADIELELTDEQKNKTFYLIAITDNGIGFEQKHAQKIFDIFRRLHTKKEYPGTGVGLSIARKVVENHYGYITAKSENGMGAEFKVYLPKSQQ